MYIIAVFTVYIPWKLYQRGLCSWRVNIVSILRTIPELMQGSLLATCETAMGN